MDDGNGPPDHYRHSLCGHHVRPVLSCSECGDPLRPEEVSAQPGVVLTAYADYLSARGESLPTAGELAREAVRHWHKNRSEQS